MSSRVFTIIALIFAALALFVYLIQRQDSDLAETGAETELVEALEPDVIEEPEPEPETEATPLPTPPSFDVVRVDPTGTAVIAGRGEPGSIVRLLDGSTVLAETTIDENGEWVLTLDEALPPGALALSLAMELPNGEVITSLEDVVVNVPERPETEAPLIVSQAEGEATEVLQNPAAEDPVGERLKIGTIDYDADGNAIFAGEADPSAPFNLYLNNRIVESGAADEEGDWSFKLDEALEPGDYTVRIDQVAVDDASDVVARAEQSFEKEPAETLVAEVEAQDRQVTVQPGNSLWRIARREYGKGPLYTLIYNANREQIRDPDLIYPGQVLDLPEITAN
ncbi:MAG: LysM peptidoglycan-binding domain-containing protein [Pseudomonadota bacterium]